MIASEVVGDREMVVLGLKFSRYLKFILVFVSLYTIINSKWGQ